MTYSFSLSLVVAPFVDIVLLTFNSATAIIFQIFLAIIFLNEVFICKYDMPALFLIILGTVCIILTANFDDHVSSVAVHKENLSDVRSMCFFVCVGVLLYLTFCILNRMRRSLAMFEKDTDLWLVNKNKPDQRDNNSQP